MLTICYPLVVGQLLLPRLRHLPRKQTTYQAELTVEAQVSAASSQIPENERAARADSVLTAVTDLAPPPADWALVGASAPAPGSVQVAA